MNLKERIPCSRNNDSLSLQRPSTAKQTLHVKASVIKKLKLKSNPVTRNKSNNINNKIIQLMANNKS